MLTLEFDGLFRSAPDRYALGNNAGVMCYGWVIQRDGVVVARGHGGYARRQDGSSNVAEYLGLIEGLEALLDMGAEAEIVVISGDSKSVIEQMEGRANVSANSIKRLNHRARRLARHFPQAYWYWTPRRNNHTADALTRRALQQIRANPRQFQATLRALERRSHGKAATRLMPILNLCMYQTV